MTSSKNANESTVSDARGSKATDLPPAKPATAKNPKGVVACGPAPTNITMCGSAPTNVIVCGPVPQD